MAVSTNYIPIYDTLHGKPQTLQIAADVGLGVDDVVGKLIRVWFWVGQHTTTKTKSSKDKQGRRVPYEVGTGLVPCSSAVAIDAVVAQDGFGSAMVRARWAVETAQGVLFPDWEKFNAKCQAARSKETSRKRKTRRTSHACPTDVPRDNGGTLLEERGEGRGVGERGNTPQEKTGVGVRLTTVPGQAGPSAAPTPPVMSVPDDPTLPRLHLQDQRICRELLESVRWTKQERGKAVEDKLHRKHLSRLLGLSGCTPMRCHMLVERVKRGEGSDNPATWIEAGLQQAFELTGADEAEYRRWYDRNHGAVDQLRAIQARRAAGGVA